MLLNKSIPMKPNKTNKFKMLIKPQLRSLKRKKRIKRLDLLEWESLLSFSQPGISKRMKKKIVNRKKIKTNSMNLRTQPLIRSSTRVFLTDT